MHSYFMRLNQNMFYVSLWALTVVTEVRKSLCLWVHMLWWVNSSLVKGIPVCLWRFGATRGAQRNVDLWYLNPVYPLLGLVRVFCWNWRDHLFPYSAFFCLPAHRNQCPLRVPWQANTPCGAWWQIVRYFNVFLLRDQHCLVLHVLLCLFSCYL